MKKYNIIFYPIHKCEQLFQQIMAWLPTWLQPWPRDNTNDNIIVPQRDAMQCKSESSSKSTFSSAESQQEILITQPTSSTSSQYDMNEEQENFFRNGPEMAIPMTGASLGFVAGFYTAATRSGLVFMAENAHRRPNTVQGWYFYNKTKNYKVLLGGAKGGAKAGLRIGLWTLAYIAIEQSVEKARNLYTQSQDIHTRWNGRWIDGATAGLGIATGASVLYRLPGQIARRSLLLGTLAGASVGGLRQLQGELADAKLQEAHSIN